MIRPNPHCAIRCRRAGGARSSSPPAAATTTTATMTPTTREHLRAAPKGDGTLTIGTLLPQTGDLAFLGPPEFAGVDLAVKDINAAGGVLGKDVVKVKADSGDGTPDIAGAAGRQAARRRLRRRSSAPRPPACRVSVIDKITGAGVVQFSPANTAAGFDTYDDKGLYFRTAPSDCLQGEVLANLVGRGRLQQRRRSWPARTSTARASPSGRATSSRRRAPRSASSCSTTRTRRTSPPRSTRSPRPSRTPSCWSPSRRPRRSSRS